jgi:hypothetical protein
MLFDLISKIEKVRTCIIPNALKGRKFLKEG